jgi:hypothetical protein
MTMPGKKRPLWVIVLFFVIAVTVQGRDSALEGAASFLVVLATRWKKNPVLFRVKYDTGGFGQWVHRLAQRAPRNKVIVAIANKLARMAWAVLSSGKDYHHQSLQPVAA